MKDRTKRSIVTCLDADLKLYQDRGFTPTEIQADGEYHCAMQSFPGVAVTICPADSHVPEAERTIRTIKDIVRATIHSMPYKRLPRTMVRELISFATRMHNMLPSPDGISTSMSPATIVTGKPKTNYHTLQLEFGTYVQVYDGTSNDTKSRTLGAIVLNPTSNTSDDHYFMSLATGKSIHRRAWTILLISDRIISRVEALALDEGMPLVDHHLMVSEYDPDGETDDSFCENIHE